jgi:hypothetical protein
MNFPSRGWLSQVEENCHGISWPAPDRDLAPSAMVAASLVGAMAQVGRFRIYPEFSPIGVTSFLQDEI